MSRWPGVRLAERGGRQLLFPGARKAAARECQSRLIGAARQRAPAAAHTNPAKSISILCLAARRGNSRSLDLYQDPESKPRRDPPPATPDRCPVRVRVRVRPAAAVPPAADCSPSVRRTPGPWPCRNHGPRAPRRPSVIGPHLANRCASHPPFSTRLRDPAESRPSP